MVNKIVKKYGLLALSLVFILALFPLLHYLSASSEPQEDESPYLRNDPARITLAANDDRVPCGECHTLEYDAWKETEHALGFNSMHRSAQAQSILEKLDYRLAKRESVCLTCHYTATLQAGKAKAIAGVTCESCHGAARDWLDVHNDYGAPNRDSETEAHKQQRINASLEAGMLRPSDNVYAVAANCFECHTVPSEELINVGRHPSGSRIELVEWMGQIQHNFLAAQWSGDETNRDPSDERMRLLHIVGRILDYEYSIRGMARATEQGSYAKAMERRVVSAFRMLDRIAGMVSIQELNAIIKLHGQVKLVPNNERSLLGIADQIRSLGNDIARSYDGSAWVAVDPLLKGGSQAEPEPASAAQASANPVEVDNVPEASTLDGGVSPQATESVANTLPTVPGQKRSRPDWFPSEKFDFIVPGCNCHAAAEDWLFDDAHGRSADPIVNGAPRAVQIARVYGLTSASMKQGDQICMQCHGTVETGTGSGPVFESVGCESCHGPSSGYLQPHKRGDGAAYGLKNLNDATVRASNCATCHHITDERLLAAGHSSGQGYDIVAGGVTIKHWPDPDLDRPPKAEPTASAVNAAFDLIKGQRPVPRVEVVSLPSSGAPGSSLPPARTPVTGRQAATPTFRSVAPRPPRSRPVGRLPAAGAADDVQLEQAPVIPDSASIEDRLLFIKKRLEALYKAVGRNG